jgi:Mg-chelatase subunit ChlD
MISKVDIRKKELGFFLSVSKIPYREIVVDRQATVVLESGGRVSPGVAWQQLRPASQKEFGNDIKLFQVVMDRLTHFDAADSFDSSASMFELAKFNMVLSNTNKALRNKNFSTRFIAGPKYGGCTAKRNEVFIFYKELPQPRYRYFGLEVPPPNDSVKKAIDEYMALVPGFNYHEVGHTMFTISFARLAKEFKKVYFTEFDQNTYTDNEKTEIVNQLLQYTNSFEDGRMENLMVQKFPGAYPYFASTAYNFLLDHIMVKAKKVKGEWIDEHDCILLSARKFLSPEVRQWVYNEYMVSGHGDLAKAQRVNGYVNKYISLSWRKNLDEMVRLVIGFYLEFGKELLEEKKKIPQYKMEAELSKLLEKLLGNMASNMNQMDEGQDSGEKFGEGEGKEIEDEVLKSILEKIMSEGKLKKGKNKGIGKPGKGEPGQGAGNGIEKLDGKDGKDKDGDDPGQGDVDEDAMKKAVKDDNGNSEGKKADHKDNMKKIMGHTRVVCGENHRALNERVTACMKKEQKKLEVYFKQLITLCRNGYMTKRKAGAVDVPEVRRQMKKLGTKVFKKYKRNMNKAFDVDIAFVLDISGSMDETSQVSCEGSFCKKVRKAAEQLWICFTSAKAVGGKHKTFTFSSGHQGALQEPRNNTEFVVPHANGGTVVGPSLMFALNYLESSPANNKWLVVLTDGDLGDPEAQNEILDTAKRMGITTGKINLGYSDEESKKIYDHVYSIPSATRGFRGNNNAQDIVAFFKKIYAVSMRKNGLTV